EPTGVAPELPEYLFPARAGFPASGLLQLEDPVTHVVESTFIDYFQEKPSIDPKSAMDGSYEYQYRLSYYAKLPGGAAEDFLVPPPTPWSNFMVPKVPPIELVADPPSAPTEIDDVGPSLTMVIRGPLASARTDDGRPQLSFPYRVMIRRKRDFTLPATP